MNPSPADPHRAITEIRNRLNHLRTTYEEAAAVVAALVSTRSKAEDRRSAVEAWHRAASAYFNAQDEAVASDALLQADQVPTWYTYRAETALNLLETIKEHYTALADQCGNEKMDVRQFEPSITAFSGIQRLAKARDAALAMSFRADYERLGLPVYGFDTEEVVRKSDPSGGTPGPNPYFDYLKVAISEVPSLKYALGVVGVAAAVSIIVSFQVDARLALVGTLAMFVFMVLLVVFARLSTLRAGIVQYPAIFLMWAFVGVSVAWVLLITSSVFFNLPKPAEELFKLFGRPG